MTKRPTSGDRKIAIAYLRVSTDDQRLGVLAQRMALEEWAKSRGVEIKAWCLDEGLSGSTAMEQRPGLQDAFAKIEEHQAGLLVIACRDRLARDVTNAGLIERVLKCSGAQSFSVDGSGNGDSPTDEFVRNVLNAAGQYERRITAARTKAALAAKIARNEPVGRPSLKMSISEETLSLIKSLRASGLSQNQVVAELNLRNVPTVSGKGRWHKRTVQEALDL